MAGTDRIYDREQLLAYCHPCETGLLHREHTSSLNDEWELGDVYDEVEDKNVGYDAGIFIEDGEVVASVVKGLSECILPQVNCWWCNIKVEHDTHEACCGEDVCSEDDGQAVGDSTDMGCVKTVGGVLRASCVDEYVMTGVSIAK